MADNNPSESFEDELLSAYIDGELTERERAQVERRLRDDPQAKQLVAELQGLSETVRSLPRETVGADLRDSVLQQAERSMLLGDETERQTVTVTTGGPRSSSPRRWIWAGLALAAALLLMVYQPTVDQVPRPLAEAQPKLGRANRSVPELRAPANGSIAKSTVGEAESHVESGVTLRPPPSDREEVQPLCRVHITFTDSQSGAARFDELLANNGIAIQERPAAALALADAAEAGGARVGRRQRSSASSSSSLPAQAGAVLVEAPSDQIERLLLACHADTENCKSLRFESHSSSPLPLPRWRQWERRGTATENLQARIGSPLEERLGTTIEALEPEVDDLNSANEADQRKPRTPRGRATRLGSDWYRDSEQAKPPRAANDEESADLFAKRDGGAKDQDLTKERSTTAPVRVLFVLHSVAPAGESEAAPAGK